MNRRRPAADWTNQVPADGFRGAGSRRIGPAMLPRWLDHLWLTRFSLPAGERILARHVLARRPARILELGLGNLRRAERLLHLAADGARGTPVTYVGIDRFESRQPAEGPGVSLKEAHRRLHGLGSVRLVPGNVDSTLSRLCNHLGAFDLVVVAADTPPRELERAWLFVQRLVGTDTTVFVESRGGAWVPLSRSQLADLASASVQRRAG